MPEATLPPPVTAPRSTFVTILAWIFIVISALSTCIALMQAAMFIFLIPHDAFSSPQAQAQMRQGPPILSFMVRHAIIIFPLFWSGAVAMLVSAIGLLRRWNWARWLFIALLAFGILWNLGSVIVQHLLIGSAPLPVAPDNAALQGMRVMMIVIQVVSAIMAVAISVLFGWIIRRLLSAPIAAEFHPPCGMIMATDSAS